MIEWNERYTTGDPVIDKQHQILFQYFNDLDKFIAKGKAKSYIKDFLPFLENYANIHFCFEERCMTEHKCPVADKNKVAHNAFIEALAEYKRKLSESRDNDASLRELHGFLEKWITGHIIGIDVHLKECLTDKQTERRDT